MVTRVQVGTVRRLDLGQAGPALTVPSEWPAESDPRWGRAEPVWLVRARRAARPAEPPPRSRGRDARPKLRAR